MWLPLSDGENSWGETPRAFLYGFLLLWFFVGVAIISDVFMVAIEEITSKKSAYLLKYFPYKCILCKRHSSHILIA